MSAGREAYGVICESLQANQPSALTIRRPSYRTRPLTPLQRAGSKRRATAGGPPLGRTAPVV
jgi:hypothetical protein